MPDVLLCDENGRITGTKEIVAAHTGEGSLHKAFSVYVFRETEKEILIQRRSLHKMLWPGIWANTCCSHPRKDESPIQAGTRRLQEEMGFTTDLTESGTLLYKAKDPSGRGIEHEHVTILKGYADDITIAANPDEVMECKWIGIDALQADMTKNFDLYAPWFHLGLAKILQNSHD